MWLASSLVVVALTGCVGSTAGPLLLGSEDDHWEVCIPRTGERVTAGDLFTAPTTGETVLSGIDLTGADGPAFTRPQNRPNGPSESLLKVPE